MLIFVLIIVSGCTETPKTVEPKTTDLILEHLEKTFEFEKEFNNQQEPLTKAAEEEYSLYNEIVDHGLADFEKIKELSDKALVVVEERKEILDKENQSLNLAEEEFNKIQPLIQEINDDKIKSEAENLYSVMQKRYDTYDEIYTNYKIMLVEIEKIYQLLQDKDVTIEQVKEQAELANSHQAALVELNEQFNLYTDEYNQGKTNFYSLLGFKIKDSE